MNSTKDILPIHSDDKSQIPFSHLKHLFLDVLFNPKYTIGADQFLKSSNNSVSLSASITDSSTITLHYEDYEGHHAVFSEEGIKRLRCIAATLSSRNELADCAQMYTKHRKSVVNLVCVRLREKLKVETVCVFTFSDELKEKTQRWIQVAKICVGTIFAIEKCFYEQIFGDLGSSEDSAANSFVYIIEGTAAELLEFPHSLLARGRLPQRPDILLPLCHELANLISHLMAYFDQDVCPAKAICNFATMIMLRLIQQIANILSVTEKHVLRELSTRPFPGGGIHPLTKYIIHHIDLIYVHRESLTELGSNDNRDPPEIPGSHEMDGGLVFLKRHLTRVIEFLLQNLKFKSNFYGQESLHCLFMMNNVNSVSEKIKSSKELEELIGTHLQMKLREKVELAKTDYFHRSWGEVCTFLKGEGLKSYFNCDFFPGRSTRAVKKKFKTFNSMFEDILQTQEGWIVPDLQLRMKLLECILAKLIPAYNHFLERLSRVYKVKRVSEYIKYSVKDLETKVLDMFQNKY
ncbi:exocyst complex component EXO70B1-like [Coffea eugenioides]|uniref:exocyst complex component EXO70B1-like n=1 Tax=Coffea eugenioides TaxID=49369 RepID=UPI000F608B24|nr:exocyst complex component EXO70B1-like [Coffea eugenioides]